MIIIRVMGGLGNQMFQYATAKSIAKKNNDEFKLDLSFYANQDFRQYELDRFLIKGSVATGAECARLRGNEGLVQKVKKRLGFKMQRPRPYVFEHELHATKFQKHIFENTESMYLDGYWQNEEYFKNIRDEILQDFTLQDSISREAKKYLESIMVSRSVSLHVRRGDYIQNPHANSMHGTCSIEYYKEAIRCIHERVENPVFYIFSDDINWCKENFDFLDCKIFIDKSLDGIEDLYLMQACDNNIIANSSFSWWGAWLNTNKSKCVVAPRIWFSNNKRRGCNLACEDWITI
ncbi:alpha-1,2-fucosyltransferase [Candidatus Thioglobus sp.]|nr:alpha-1,2-fucosyltransferase [Candidatus Thioglobus sp.]